MKYRAKILKFDVDVTIKSRRWFWNCVLGTYEKYTIPQNYSIVGRRIKNEARDLSDLQRKNKLMSLFFQ